MVKVKNNLQFLLVLSLSISATCCIGRDNSGLAYFDPGNPDHKNIAKSAASVEVKIEKETPTLVIPPCFYGINSHPLPAEEAFRCPELVKTLKPDSIRIMTLERIFWYRENGKVIKKVESLSPGCGQFKWKLIDAIMQKINDFGAEPYIAIGFGAPKWLNSANEPRFGRPLRKDIPEYADFIADIAAHIAKNKFNVHYVTVDNEPENVKFPIEDYVLLYQLASKKIHQTAPGLKIAGPTTGYAYWTQPDGRKMGFTTSLKYLYNAGIRFDAIDWHIYSLSHDRIYRTVDAVKRVYGSDAKLFISELNLDWRYSGKGGNKSKHNNTSWNSVSWLAEAFDGLQQRGVDRVYFFCLRNNFFGLYDYHINEVRPNYYTFWMFTNLLGRQRVTASASHPGVGVIATLDTTGKYAIMLYSKQDIAAGVKLSFDCKNMRCYTFSRQWYERNKKIVDGNATIMPSRVLDSQEKIIIPPKGIVVIKE